MKAKYVIDKATKTLVFNSKTKSLKKDSICLADKNSFTYVVIPNSVSTIEKRAFCSCSSLASVHIPNSVSVFRKKAFAWCESLSSIHIPNSVTTFDQGAFYECTSLGSIHIPKSVLNIDTLLFCNCSSLASVHIPNSINTVGSSAFGDYSNLHKVCVPINSKIHIDSVGRSFRYQTSIFRPRLKPISVLQRKHFCYISKTARFINL